MKLSVLIGLLESNLQKHKEHSPAPQAGNVAQRETYYIYLETQLTLRQMQAVIDQLKQFGGDTDITSTHTKLITDFLKTRWDRVKNTNAIYSIELQSRGNLVCIEAAEFLAKHLKDVVGNRSHFALLMPTVKSWRSSRVGIHDIDMKYLHNFLLTDDNRYCIEIGFLKESLKNGKLVLSHKEDGTERSLSEKEIRRVCEHSKVVEEYYQAIKPLLRDAKYHNTEIGNKKLDLRDALSKPDYAKYGLGSTYGVEGQELLRANLLQNVDELFATSDQLYDYMAEKSKPSEWDRFLNSLSTEALSALVKNGGSLKDAVKSANTSNHQEHYVRAAAFCLVETYLRERQKQGLFTSYPAYIHRQAYDKPTKEHAVQAIKEFLVNKPLAGWDEFVKSQDELLAGAIKDGTVGSIGGLIQSFNLDRQSSKDRNAGASILRSARI